MWEKVSLELNMLTSVGSKPTSSLSFNTEIMGQHNTFQKKKSVASALSLKIVLIWIVREPMNCQVSLWHFIHDLFLWVPFPALSPLSALSPQGDPLWAFTSHGFCHPPPRNFIHSPPPCGLLSIFMTFYHTHPPSYTLNQKLGFPYVREQVVFVFLSLVISFNIFSRSIHFPEIFIISFLLTAE